MNNQMTANEVVQAFCHQWFEQRDANGAAAFLAEDVDFVGTGVGESAEGKLELMQYIRRDIAEIAEPFLSKLSFIHENTITEDVYCLSAEMTLTNTAYTWYLRGFFTLHAQEDDWLIKSFHFAEPSSSQQGEEHYPGTLVMENIARQRQELLNDSLAGGMMGGYMGDGFPFYFINRRMLAYLGYTDEKDFTDDIEGLISNCMHPDDRKLVDECVAEQLKDGSEYVVEYRMKKKDGSYIWVHDIGQCVTAENGRPAIASVCIDITAQKKAQDEVLHLYNNIPGAVFRCRSDAELFIIDANDGFYEFFGCSREEFASEGNKMRPFIHPEDLPYIEEMLQAPEQYDQTIHLENRVVCKDGTVKWISAKAQLFVEDGEPYFYCVFVDVTEEKKLQERVRELYEQELSYFAELSPMDGNIQGVFNITQDRVESYLSTSSVIDVQVGDSYTETIRHLAGSATDPAEGEEIRQVLGREKIMAEYDAGKVDYHIEFLRKKNDGSLFWESTNLRSCLNPMTGDIMVFFYSSDITEQKAKDLLLNKITELDYEYITELDILKGTHRVTSFSNKQKNLLAYEGDFRKEAFDLASRLMDETARKEYLEKLDFGYIKNQLSKQDSYTFLVEMKDEEGRMRVKRFRVFYISRELYRVGIACIDVTDIVRQEQRQRDELAAALVAAEQANAAKTDFLSRMSHEIRTPMNAIIGMSAIAAGAIGDDEQVADCISKIGISSRFLLSLINDILDMSRIESGKMLLKSEKIPTEEFLNGVNSICYAQANAKGVEYECIVDPVLDDYYIGDAMKLQQVLINILSNAIKFTGQGGKVTFSVNQRSRAKHDAVLRFIVNDTGVGMSEEFLPRIFEPFSQESTGTTALYGGTGLGLAISKNIVDMMDGKVTVRSIKGIGTEFIVDVKLGITDEEKLRHNQKKPEYHFSHLKTLVVDDDVTVCECVVATLKEMGVIAEWTDSGQKALDRVKELRDKDKYFDMILIDWKMPDMDGIETARRIRAIVGPNVTIIIITAYDWIPLEHEAKLAGVNLLISKPMFKSSLISAFSKALGEKEEQGQQMAPAEYDFSGKRILLVEDNPINTEVAAMLLKNKGFLVETAENGLRAMELFSKSEEGYYHAILMDIRMPLMDGLTAANNIRHLSNADAETIPIVAMTANAFEDDIEKSKAAGMNAHLAKPIEPERLYQTLYDFIFGLED